MSCSRTKIQCFEVLYVYCGAIWNRGNNLATPPGRITDPKFKGEFLASWEAKYVDFERVLFRRADRNDRADPVEWCKLVKGICSQMPTVRVQQLSHSGR